MQVIDYRGILSEQLGNYEVHSTGMPWGRRHKDHSQIAARPSAPLLCGAVAMLSPAGGVDKTLLYDAINSDPRLHLSIALA